MKKELKICSVVLVLFMLAGVMCSCFEDSTPAGTGSNSGSGSGSGSGSASSSVPKFNGNSADEYTSDVHYLEFYFDDELVARLAVNETDTYEDLAPFFPTIPQGYVGYEWETLDKVYDRKNKNIRITLVEIQETEPVETETFELMPEA